MYSLRGRSAKINWTELKYAGRNDSNICNVENIANIRKNVARRWNHEVKEKRSSLECRGIIKKEVDYNPEQL